MTVTALRSETHQVRDGVRLLRPNPDSPYRDGAEDRLWMIVGDANDLGSQSTEMLAVATGWAEQYHTHPGRANIVRALDIPVGATILEIGSGCGAITRYLGETGAEVDSVEPVLPRARVGRRRTRDLPNVEVFCGSLEEIPPAADYDIVMVVGVLEYVGGGSADRSPYLAFLDACRTRLRPGGTLVIAIENKLGVKYLTGTGEDHSGRIFDSIEDYPSGTPARTFSATALCGLVSEVGLTPLILGAFPDYKHTRVVFDTNALQTSAPDLLENLPVFPSRFAGTRSLKLASEARVWRELVRDGIGQHFVNSFLVLATADTRSGLWPDGRLAQYFSINRRPEYSTSTCVNQVGELIRFDRRVNDAPGPLIKHGMSGWDYVKGDSFLRVFHAADDAVRQEMLERWIVLVSQARVGDTVPVDAIPTNVIVDETGTLRLIDNEFHEVSSLERVIVRGLFWLGVHITRDTPPTSWEPATTVGGVVDYLARLVGISLDSEAVERLQLDESAFQVAVTSNYLQADASHAASEAVRRLLDTDLRELSLGRRLHDRYDEVVKTRAHLREQYDAAIAQRDRLQEKLDKFVAQRDVFRRQEQQPAD